MAEGWHGRLGRFPTLPVVAVAMTGVLPASTAVLGIEGAVEVTGRRMAASVMLNPGQGTDVAPGAAPTPPVTWGAPRVERTLGLVGPAIR